MKKLIIHNPFSVVITILIGIFLAVMLFLYQVPRMQAGPEQPIPFSHRVHVQEKNISCFMCHEGAGENARAGIPPLQTCMLCHDRIIIHHPEIENLREHYFNNIPVKWVKIEDVPDFTYFHHGVHLQRKIDCAECHGNIRQMDRIEKVNEFEMGFCVDCHREKGASIDCYTCHR